MNKTETYYRYEDYLEGDDEYSTPIVRVMLREFSVDRKTPCGVWIKLAHKDKFILNNATKRFAYPTKEEAKISFRKRKKTQIRILKYRIQHAEEALNIELE